MGGGLTLRITLLCSLLLWCWVYEGAGQQYQNIDSLFTLPAGSIVDFCNKSNGCQISCIDGTHPLGGYTCNNSDGILEVNPITALIYQTMKASVTVNYIAGNSVDLVKGQLYFSYSIDSPFPDYLLVPLAQAAISDQFKKYGINMHASRILVAMNGPIFSLTIFLPKTITVSVPSTTYGNITELNLGLFSFYHLNISSLVDKSLLGAFDNVTDVSVYFIESLSKPQNQDPDLNIRACDFAQLLATNETLQGVYISSEYLPAFDLISSTDSSCDIYWTPPPPAPSSPPTLPPSSPPTPSSSIRSSPFVVLVCLCILIVFSF